MADRACEADRRERSGVRQAESTAGSRFRSAKNPPLCGYCAERGRTAAEQNQKSQYRPMSHRRKETTMNKNKEFEHEIDPELLEEIRLWEEADHDELTEYYFSCSDPYLKPQPLPPDHVRHNCYFNEDGHLCVKNLSAFWLPEFTLQKEIGGTLYTVTGSYDGTETLDKKMERIMGEKFTEKKEEQE